jgi:hypothetical protein
MKGHNWKVVLEHPEFVMYECDICGCEWKDTEDSCSSEDEE